MVKTITEVVLFDVDDTLLPTSDIRKETERGIVSLLSQKTGYTPQDLEVKYNQSLRATAAGRFAYPNARDDLRARIAYFLSLLGSPSEVSADDLTDFYLMARERNLRLTEGAYETLTALTERRYKLGISTDHYPDFQRSVLNRLGILELFELGIFARINGYHKPTPEFFREVIARLKTDPYKIGHVGDDLIADISAPRNAGLRPCILFDGTSRHPVQLAPSILPDYRITHLNQSLDIFL